MARLIDQIGNSGLFAQSAISASIATNDSLGRNISTTYLTAHQDVSDKLDVTAFTSWSASQEDSDYELSAGNGITLYDDSVNKITRIDVTAAGGDVEVNTYVQNNSAGIDNAISTYQSNSSTYITAHQDLSNYYTKSQTSGASELAQAFSDIVQDDTDVSTLVHSNSSTWNDVTNKLDKSESANYYPMTGNPSKFIPQSALNLKINKISGIGGSALSVGNHNAVTFPLSDGFGGIDIGIPYDNGYLQYLCTDHISEVTLTTMPKVGNYKISANSAEYIIPGNSWITFYEQRNSEGQYRWTIKDYNGSGVLTSATSTTTGGGGGTGDMSTSLLEYNDNSQITGYNGTAFAGQGGGSTPTYDYTDNNLISAIDTSGLYATRALKASSANSVVNSGRLGTNVYAVTGDGTGKTLMILNPNTTPFGNTSGIYGPLYYAQGACMTYGSSAGNTQYFGGFFKGNEWYVSNATAGQALRGETHLSRGVHLSGATTGGKSFDLSVNCVRGKNSVGEWRYGPAEDTALRTASAWNDTIDVVQSNSSTWGQGGGSVDTIPFVVNSPLVTGFTGTSAYLGLDSTAIDMSPYIPYSALSEYWDGRVHTIKGSAIYAEYADDSQRANGDSNGDDFTNNYQKISAMSDYQTSLTFDGSDNTITAINNSAIGGTMESFELSAGNNISIVDDIATSATIISVSGISANEWNDTTNVVQANSASWVALPQINFVSTSSEATGTNILYVVTGAGA